MSALATADMSAVQTGPMSAAETGQMSAAETGQMSAVETRQMLKSQIRGRPKVDPKLAQGWSKIGPSLGPRSVQDRPRLASVQDRPTPQPKVAQASGKVRSWLTKVPVLSKNIKFGPKWVENRPFGLKLGPNES